MAVVCDEVRCVVVGGERASRVDGDFDIAVGNVEPLP
jgi:hypothetical protein